MNDQDYYNALKVVLPKKLTLSQHVEMWFYENTGSIPDRGTPVWDQIYEKWVAFAFVDKENQ